MKGIKKAAVKMQKNKPVMMPKGKPVVMPPMPAGSAKNPQKGK